MADHDEKTSVVSTDTFKIRLSEAKKAPPSFVLLMGPVSQVGRQWPVEKSGLILGRSVECYVFVDDRSVSKRHAEIILEGSDVFIKDLGSTNGTEVDGTKIDPNLKKKLGNNNQIKCGNIIFKFLEQGSLESFSNQKSYDRTQLDPLTNIFNKGALVSHGEECIRKAKLIDVPLGVIVFDLDNFKNINDTFGHPAGDYVLNEMSTVIQKKLIRSDDFFARWGGEEFCLILLGSPLNKSVEVAERLRATIEGHNFNYKGTKLEVTISVGVANLDSSMDSWDQLFDKADKATYLSKKNGKNRVSTI